MRETDRESRNNGPLSASVSAREQNDTSGESAQVGGESESDRDCDEKDDDDDDDDNDNVNGDVNGDDDDNDNNDVVHSSEVGF